MEGRGRIDRPSGGRGEDLLVGGTGNDLLIGGARADLLRFDPGDCKDRPPVIEDGIDRIRIASGVAGIADDNIQDTDADSVIRFTGVMVTLVGRGVSLIGPDDFRFVQGAAGPARGQRFFPCTPPGP